MSNSSNVTSMMIARLVLVLLLQLTVKSALAQSLPMDSAAIAGRIQTVIDDAMKDPRAVALSVAVAQGDQIVLADGVGLAEIEHGVVANANTAFRIGSLTKQFTAAAIMRLVERGKLKLDDDMSKYLMDFPIGGHKITIRHLLMHTSGIPNYTAQPEFSRLGIARELQANELLAFVKDVPFDFEPGSKWKYSNTGYYLLGLIIEHLDGRPYAQFLEEEFFQPLGLQRTRYDSNQDVIPNRAQGYGFDKKIGKHINDSLIGMANPGAAGGLISTAGNLVRWQMALTTGHIVSEASYSQMITSTIATNPDQPTTLYGFGLGISVVDGHRRVFHNGNIYGFNSMLAWYPETDIHIAVISNSEIYSSQKIERDIFRAIMAPAP